MRTNRILILALLILLFNPFTKVGAQDKGCVFCDIAGGMQASRLVYKDSLVISFLSHAPDNPGHLLVIPIKHARYFTEIPDPTLADMMRVAKYLIKVVQSTDIKAEGFQLLLNSGEAAGQHVKHTHLHIIPRYKGEVLNTTQTISPSAELDAVAEKIRYALVNVKELLDISRCYLIVLQ